MLKTTLSDSFFARWCPDPTSVYDLVELYAEFNAKFFNGELPVLPTVTLTNDVGETWERTNRIKWEGRYKRTWGTYTFNGRGTGTIKLARRCALEPFQTQSTLLHEMIHAWLDLRNEDDGIAGHGPNFIRKAKEINEKCDNLGVGYRVDFHDEPITQEVAEFQVPLLMSSFQFDDLDVAKKVESIINGAFAGSYEYSQ
jgi:hypothetical protein